MDYIVGKMAYIAFTLGIRYFSPRSSGNAGRNSKILKAGPFVYKGLESLIK